MRDGEYELEMRSEEEGGQEEFGKRVRISPAHAHVYGRVRRAYGGIGDGAGELCWKGKNTAGTGAILQEERTQ